MQRLHKFTIYSIGMLIQLTVRSVGIELQDFLIDRTLNLWLGTTTNIPEHYSPFWGVVMKNSGFLGNLRFLGNYNKSTVGRMSEENNVFLCDRRFDEGKDNIMKLIIQLFPSNASDSVDLLESVWDSPTTIGNFFRQRLESDKPQALQHLAGLMLKAEVFRLSLSGQNPFIPKIVELSGRKPVHEFYQHCHEISRRLISKDPDEQNDMLQILQYLLKRKMGLQNFNTLLVNAIRDESSAGYQQFTVEHALLAFIFDLVRNKEDAQFLLNEWSGMRTRIFLPSYLGNDQYIPFGNREALTAAAQEICVSLMYPLQGLPYQIPIAAGSAEKWITWPDGRIQNTSSEDNVEGSTFPDCVETSIRHLFNYTLGSNGIHSFNKKGIRERVRTMFQHDGQLRRNDHLDAMENFYKSFVDPNDGSCFARSLWNLVTFGLNSEEEVKSPHHVEYAIANDILNSGNNIRSNICNVLKTIGGILGIRAATVMNKVKTLDDILARLNDLLSLINDANTYNLQVTKSRLDDYQNVASCFTEASINIIVRSKNKSLDDGCYAFTFHSLAGHGFVSLPNSQIITISNATVDNTERNLFSYFFGGYAGQSLYSHVFSLPFAGKFDSMLLNAVRAYENTGDINLHTSLQTVFEKIAERILFTNADVASDLYKSILLACNFNNTTYQIVRHAAYDPDTLPPTLENVILHLSQDDAQLFDMSHNNGFTTSLSLSGAISQIIREGRLPTHIKSLKLMSLGRAIDDLDLTHFSELTSLGLYCASLNGFKLPVNGKLKSYTIKDRIYEA
ncbi:MAG: hypothetical protein LBF65_01865 [Holosporales bacterium]|jgi:hypothetical protein|nr:hypothetical protein [Holosporales bacterium]